jgi:putative redox protein
MSAPRAVGEAKPAKVHAPNVVHASWKGEQRFESGRPNGPTFRVDGTGATAQSPVDALLSALASCVSIDVVEIMAKRRTPASRLEVTVTGNRVETTPRRISAVRLDFAIDGDGIEREQAERAIDLGLNKYCSVRESLAQDILFSWSLTLNGEPGAPGE